MRPAQTHYNKIPAQYQTVHRQVLVRPAQRVAHHIPAVSLTVAETVMIAPATKVWSVTRDAHGREVGCWVQKPAQYATRHRTVIVRPASVSYSVIPAQYRTVTQQMQVRPAQLVAHTTPAVVGTRNVTQMVAPATTGWQPIGHHARRGHHRHH
ncbi:MAG: hypothetical protein FJX29_12825 [Alphaproteobacteria bacterium]|nr:hypothetical protein [Alphaproteobacteria bacterium]